MIATLLISEPVWELEAIVTRAIRPIRQEAAAADAEGIGKGADAAGG